MPPRVHRSRHAASALCVLTLVAVALTGCTGPGGAPPPVPVVAPSPPVPPPPAEPGDAPPVTSVPLGRVLSLPGGAPEGAVVDPSTGILAVALRQPDRLALIDTASGNIRTIPAPGGARHLSLGAPGELLVPGEDTDVLAQIALPGGTVTAQTKVGRQPHDAARADGTLFVSNEFGGSIGVVRGGRMAQQLAGLVQPGGLTISDGRWLAAVDVRGNAIHVADVATLRDTGVLPAGQGPSHVRPIAPGQVAVADTRGNAVLTYQVSGVPRQLHRVAVPGRAYGLATDAVRGALYVTLPNTNQVQRWRFAPDGALRDPRTMATVRQPNEVTVDPRTGAVFVVGEADAQGQDIPAQAFGPL